MCFYWHSVKSTMLFEYWVARVLDDEPKANEFVGQYHVQKTRNKSYNEMVVKDSDTVLVVDSAHLVAPKDRFY